MVKLQADFNLTPTKTITILSRILGLIDDSLCQASYHIQKVGHQQWVRPWKHAATDVGWMILMVEARRWKMWKMCPTEISMCIKLLADMDVPQNHRWNYTHQKKNPIWKCCLLQQKKPLLGFKIGPCELWFHTLGSLRGLLGFCDGECSRATNDLRIWMKRKLMFCWLFSSKNPRTQGPGNLDIRFAKNLLQVKDVSDWRLHAKENF